MLAIQFMTRVPLPALDVSAADFQAAIRWFPLAGLVVGSAVALAFTLGNLISPWLAALAGVAALALDLGVGRDRVQRRGGCEQHRRGGGQQCTRMFTRSHVCSKVTCPASIREHLRGRMHRSRRGRPFRHPK